MRGVRDHPAQHALPDRGEVSWHTLSPDEVAALLGTDLRQGLSPEEATRRARAVGLNVLPETGRPRLLRLFFGQFTNALMAVLLAAVVISLLLGNTKEAVAVAAVVLLNAALGFFQEYQAERAMAALRGLAVPRARVRRADRVAEIPSRELVPGDLILLQAGDRVPADGRLVEAFGLRIDESSLTGESLPVEKDATARLNLPTPLADRRNMVYLGTGVTAGRAVVVVTATGARTELGRIAGLVTVTRPHQSPLQRRLEGLARTLGVFAAAIVLAVAILGAIRGEEPGRIWLMAVSLAVAAVPEGLPVVLTLALSLGAQRMLRRNALIRQLSSVETLGSVTVICTDKTGTLTENRLTVAELWTPDGSVGAERDPQEAVLPLLVACLCNDAELDPEGRLVGDPVDVALARAAAQWGAPRRRWQQALPRHGEWPFDARRRRMVTLHEVSQPDVLPPGLSGRFLTLVKGAPEAVLPRCRRIWKGEGEEMLGGSSRGQVESRVEELARRGVRVLALAFGSHHTPPAEEEEDLTFLGLVGLVDPLRPEVSQAVARCKQAGIRVVLVTGDHPATALATAREAGIVEPGCEQVLTGPELDAMNRDDLARAARTVSVFARTTPEHKLLLVESLQALGEVVAVTGDGVNDGPALRRAAVGVAMGSGTDLAKEAAGVVLLDDNFATVVAAVEEGRVAFENVRKFVRYLFTTNVAELQTVLTAVVLGLPFPLSPLQILWINLVTDGPPALALGVEPAEEDVMRRAPRRPDEPFLTPRQMRQVVWGGVLMGTLALGVGAYYLARREPAWQTVVFAALTLAQFFNVYAVRTSTPLWRPGPRNPALSASVALGVGLLALAVYVPFLQPYFYTRPLTPEQVAVCLLPGIATALAAELGELRQARMRASP